MQKIHRPLRIPLRDQGQDIEPARKTGPYGLEFRLGWAPEHIGDEVAPRGRATDTDAQPPEIRADTGDDVRQPVMAARAAALFQARDPRRKIEFVVRD
jgi:hypothetical protein